MFDDGLTDLDFDFVDSIIQQHQEKQQGSQAPASPYGKGPQGSSANTAPNTNAAPPAAGQQHLNQQPQLQQQQHQELHQLQQQPQHLHQNQQQQQQQQRQPPHVQHAHGQRHPQQAVSVHKGVYGQQQYGAVQHRAVLPACHPQIAPSQQPARQASQHSAYAVHSRHHTASAPQGHISLQAASALGQQPQHHHQQLSQQQPTVQMQPQQLASQQAGSSGTSSTAPGQQGLEGQLRHELDQLQRQVNQLQGSNSLLRGNLDRVTRERDEKQRSLQQQQQSGLSAFTAAEAQKQVNVLQQQLAFKTQEEEGLQRRCAEKDEQMQHLEQQVVQLEGQLREVQLQLGLSGSDRQDRGIGGTSALLNPPLPIPRHLSPSPSRQRKSGSSSASGSKLTGTKRKLSSLLGDASGGVAVGSPLANGHGPLLPPASQQNGQHASLPARRSTGVQAVASPQAAAPSVTPLAPDMPAHELPSWSRSSPSLHSSNTALQQLWLQCPDSLALLLHPVPSQASMRNNSQRMQVPMPSASSALGLTLHTNGLSNVGQSAPAGSRQASHTCMGTAQFQGGVSQGPGGAGASASALLHHRVQMLACNASSAGVLMLQTLVQLLQQPCLPHLRKQDGAAEAAAREAGTNPQQKDAAAGQAWQAEETRVAAACFDVLTVLIAHDSSCQQAIQASCSSQASTGSQVPDQAVAAIPNAKDIAGLIHGMQLSSRLSVSFSAQPASASASSAAAHEAPSSRHSASLAQAGKHGKDLLQLILQLIPDLLTSWPAAVHSALRCLSAIVAVTPIPDRAALDSVVISGVLELAMSKPAHTQQALHLLHMLAQSDGVCAMLDQGLLGGPGSSPEPDSHMANADEAGDSARHSSRPDNIGQQQQQGQSVQNAIDLDSHDRPVRWKGTAALLHSLMASLDVNTEPAPPATPEPTPGQPLTPSHLPSASVATQPAALRTPTNSLQSRRGVHRTPRLALLVLATLLQQNQYGLLLYMVKQDQGDAERGCLCQSLLEMVDAVTRGGSDDLLAGFSLPCNPATPPLVTSWHQTATQQTPTSSSNKTSSQEAGDRSAADTNAHSSIEVAARLWQDSVRLAQEAMTLLRMILNNSSLGEKLEYDAGRVGIESLVSSSSAIRLSLITSMRLSHWAEEVACVTTNHESVPLPVQPWVATWGSSSSHVKFVNGSADCRGDLVCSSVQDVAHMAKSLRTRVLLKLNRMSA